MAASTTSSDLELDASFNQIVDSIKSNPQYKTVIREGLITKLLDSKAKADVAYVKSAEFADLLRHTQQNVGRPDVVAALLRALRKHKTPHAATAAATGVLNVGSNMVSAPAENANQSAPSNSMDTLPKEAASTEIAQAFEGSRRRHRADIRPEDATVADVEKVEIYLERLNSSIKKLMTEDAPLDQIDEIYVRLAKQRAVGKKWSRWLDKARAALTLAASQKQQQSDKVGTTDESLLQAGNTESGDVGAVSSASAAPVAATTEKVHASSDSKPSTSNSTIIRAMERPLKFSEIERNRSERKYRQCRDETTELSNLPEIGGLVGERKERFRSALSWFNKFVRMSGVRNDRLPFEAPDFELTLAQFVKLANLTTNDSSSTAANGNAAVDTKVKVSSSISAIQAVPDWLYDEALVFFTRARSAIRQRAQQDAISSIRLYADNNFTMDDPAKSDPQLEEKLEEHSRIARQRTDELVERCASLENDKQEVESGLIIRAYVDSTQSQSQVPTQPESINVSDPLQTADDQTKQAESVTQTVAAASEKADTQLTEHDNDVADEDDTMQDDGSDVEIVGIEESDVTQHDGEASPLGTGQSRQGATDSEEEYDDYATVKLSSETVRVHLGLKSQINPPETDDAGAPDVKRARIQVFERDDDACVRGDWTSPCDRPTSSNSSVRSQNLPLTSSNGGAQQSAIVISDDDD